MVGTTHKYTKIMPSDAANAANGGTVHLLQKGRPILETLGTLETLGMKAQEGGDSVLSAKRSTPLL